VTHIILQITAGQGTPECQWVVSRLAAVFREEALALGLTCTLVVDATETSTSLLLSVSGKGCEIFAANRSGSIRWIGKSPFRPKHRRKNWYVGVRPVPGAQDIAEIDDQDIKYQMIRASGPGGQHVNKSDSAVRATHMPTGIATLSRDQRSQFANKKIARLKLALIFEERKQSAQDQSRLELWQRGRKLERGNEVRCYEGISFRLRRL